MSNRNPPVVTLPRGRHKLPREHVLDSQRQRLVAAMLESVEERGFAATTIGHVVAKARVSRNAFYAQFEDKEACFLAACDEAATRMLDELYAAAAADTWLEAAREGMRRYLRWWQDHPRYAVAYLVELPTAGRRALEQRDRAYARFITMQEAMAARARAEQPELAPLEPLSVRLLVVAATEVVGQEVRAGRLERLHELEDQLLFAMVKALADDATARRAVG